MTVMVVVQCYSVFYVYSFAHEVYVAVCAVTTGLAGTFCIGSLQSYKFDHAFARMR